VIGGISSADRHRLAGGAGETSTPPTSAHRPGSCPWPPPCLPILDTS